MERWWAELSDLEGGDWPTCPHSPWLSTLELMPGGRGLTPPAERWARCNWEEQHTQDPQPVRGSAGIRAMSLGPRLSHTCALTAQHSRQHPAIFSRMQVWGFPHGRLWLAGRLVSPPGLLWVPSSHSLADPFCVENGDQGGPLVRLCRSHCGATDQTVG